MKKILILPFVLTAFLAHSQAPPNTRINMGYYWYGGVFDRLHAPGFNVTPSLRAGQWAGAGAIGIDTILNKFFFYSGGNWIQLASGGNPAGNYGNLQLNRNGSFAAGGTDSLSYSTTNGLTVKNSVGIGTTTPDSKALLEILSTTKGVLFPRLTTTQQNAIATPTTGLMIWNTDSSSLMQYTGSVWQNVHGGGSGGSSQWTTSGSNIYYNNPVGIGNTGPVASAIVEITSTTKGLLVPRMNTAQQNGIASPATGLLIWNTDSLMFRFYNGSGWITLGGGTGGGGGVWGTVTGTLSDQTDLQSALDARALNSRVISTTSPLTGGGDLTGDRTIAINNAAADGTTKGASTYTAADFNDNGSGLISLDYSTAGGPQRRIASYDSSYKIVATSTGDSLFNRDYINIKSKRYNCIPDGVTDNSTGLQLALDDAAASGRPVFIPACKQPFVFGTGLVMGDNVIIFGTGKSSWLKYTGTLRAISVGNNTVCKDFRIQGNGKASGHSFETGFFGYQKLMYRLEGLYVTQFGGNSGQNGGGGINVNFFATGNTEGAHINNCFVDSCKAAINIELRGEYILITNTTSTNSDYGLGIGAGNVYCTNMNVQKNTYGLFMFDGTNDGHGSLTGIAFNHNTYNQIADQDIGMYISNCGFYYGALVLKNNNALRFVNCDFGSEDSMHLENNTNIYRVGCMVGKTQANNEIPGQNPAFSGERFNDVACLNFSTFTDARYFLNQINSRDSSITRGPLQFNNVPFSSGAALKLLAVDTTNGNVFRTLPTGTGTVTNVAGTNANNVSFSISNASTTPNITLSTTGSPSASTDFVPKSYVDNAISGVHFKQAVKYASAAALPANTYNNGTSGVGATITENGNGALSVDGNTPSTNDRILIKDEATQANNGIYTVTTVGTAGTQFVLTRATDFDQSAEITSGDATLVTNGSANSNTQWAYNGVSSPTMGSTSLTFAQIGSASSIADNSVTNAKLAQMGAHTYKGNNTGSTANAADITSTQLTADLNVFTTSLQGLAPSSGGGTTNFLRADGTFADPINSNVVQKVNATTYTAGQKQSFVPSATNAGINIGTLAGDPSSPADGDILINTSSDVLRYRKNGVWRSVVNLDEAQTLTNKTLTSPLGIVKADVGLGNVDNTSDATKNSATAILTNKEVQKRVSATGSATSTTPNLDSYDMHIFTNLAANLTINNPTGTFVEGEEVLFRIKGDATPRTLTWGTNYRASSDLPLPTTTVANKTIYIKFYVNATDTKLDLVSVLNNF